jgi:hypothetical protein
MRTRYALTATALVVALATSLPAQESLRFVPLAPCRIVDTRNADGPIGGPVLQHGIARAFPINGRCGVPATAKAAALNLTVAGASNLGHLTVWPCCDVPPLVSNLNFNVGEYAVANSAIMPLTPGAGNIAAYAAVSGGGTAHLVVDVTGYYQ